MKINETIIVEGRDDTRAIKSAVDAETIETHGFGFDEAVMDMIDVAYRKTGIIIFTDPDYAGGKIRRRLLQRYPDAMEAFLDVDDALKDDDIGVENASPDSIRAALARACRPVPIGSCGDREELTMSDLLHMGLVGTVDASRKRQEVGKIMGIGYGNARTFLRRLNHYGFTLTDLQSAINSVTVFGDVQK